MIKKEVLNLWLFTKREELIQQTMALISEDAPKNKFSILTGKLKMIEEIESDIPDLVKKTREP